MLLLAVNNGMLFNSSEPALHAVNGLVVTSADAGDKVVVQEAVE